MIQLAARPALSSGTFESMRTSVTFQQGFIQTSMAERLLGHLHTLLMSDVDIPCAQLELCSAEEEQQILLWSDCREAEKYGDGCIHTSFFAQSQLSPNQTAVIDEPRSLTYRQLAIEASHLATKLLSYKALVFTHNFSFPFPRAREPRGDVRVFCSHFLQTRNLFPSR